MNLNTSVIPIFPLNGAILFPKSNLPLNIFEERYLAMVDYALSHEKKIGMVQTSIDDSKSLFKIGCVGKITSFNETEDRRYLINLHGLKCFKIINEVNSDEKFRLCNVRFENSYMNNLKLNEKNFDKKTLLQKLKLYFDKKDQQINLDSIEKVDCEELIKLVAMACPFAVSEKQMLLESKNIKVLAENLLSLIDFYIFEKDQEKSIN